MPGTGLATRDVLRRFYGVSLVYGLAGGFLVGVYPLFLRSRGLTQLETSSVLAVYFAVMILADVPTGACADALGRRRAFMLGCALRAAAFALYFASHAYVGFLGAEAIDAVGTAFCNGAVEAWGIDALDEAGYAGAKDRVLSRVAQLTGLGLMASAVVGAAVADTDLARPWLLGAAGFLAVGALGALLREGARPAAHPDLRGLGRALAERVGAGFRRGVALRPLLLLSLAEAILMAVWTPLWLEWPLIFGDGYGVGVWVVGWVFCVLMLAMVGGSELVARRAPGSSHRAGLVSGIVVGAGALLFAAGASTTRPNLALALLVVMNVCLGAREPLVRAWVNEEIGAAERATMLSFRTTLGTAGAALGLLLAGWMTDLGDIPLRWRLGAVLALLAVPCYAALRPRGRARMGLNRV